MNFSTNLFINEQNAIRIARRLQEQNEWVLMHAIVINCLNFTSQLLEILLEINDSHRLVPPFLRYDLRSPAPSVSDLPDLEPDYSPRGIPKFDAIKATLEEAEGDLQRGEITPREYDEMCDKLLKDIETSTRISTLTHNIPHTDLESLSLGEVPYDINGPSPAGFLDPAHEEDYLASMDAAMDPSDSQQFTTIASYSTRTSERQEKERDANLRNPVSVYNWLRRNAPSVFENPDEKPPVPGRNSKRASNIIKQEPELLDDEGNLLSSVVEGPTKVKRKRDDEPYRPKGGSSRPSKRRKAGSGPAEEKQKATKANVA